MDFNQVLDSIMSGDINAFRKCIDSGKQNDIIPETGNTLLTWAVAFSQYEIVKTLLENTSIDNQNWDAWHRHGIPTLNSPAGNDVDPLDGKIDAPLRAEGSPRLVRYIKFRLGFPSSNSSHMGIIIISVFLWSYAVLYQLEFASINLHVKSAKFNIWDFFTYFVWGYYGTILFNCYISLLFILNIRKKSHVLSLKADELLEKHYMGDQ